ncbi:hypothetical protein MNEG_5478 [Monoraphidium neglectum]|uniref:Kelch repeat-containing protein n=1 Tax=Monoraphidium neglectum TaxID=145388 RepID=A0A0D2JUC3_9CHLO|nr:hypothetical protein MNEG_5478 [Monoraphidium neglectum]KIZ02483.1 hypothetical protein MNEG_5478 [Monoraphidium neglectum]|eukprot:XP_013901502.1 hypothetical protein MNEG_5478 [Monoraphidium neglectum]
MELADKKASDAAGLTDGAGVTAGGARRRRRCNPAIILGSLGFALGLISLIFAIYAATVARKGLTAANSGGGTGAVLSTDPRRGPAGAAFDGGLFAGSGYFAPMRPMKYSRSDFRASPVGNDIYLTGGLTNEAAPIPGDANSTVAKPTGRAIPNLVRYDTYTGAARELAPMPEPRTRHAAAVYGNNIYIMGGLTDVSDPDKHDPAGTVLVYDVTKGTWSTLPGRLTTPRTDACATAIDGKIYLMGGWAANYSAQLGGEVLDLKTGAWSPLPDGMIKRGDCECAALDDCVFVVGGWGPEDFSNVSECYHPSKGAWSRRADMPRPRGDFAAELLPGGRVLVLGGESGLPGKQGSNEHAMHHVDLYDFGDDVWTRKAPLPEARFRFDAAHVDQRVYVYGGQPTCTNSPKDNEALGRQPCVKVALDSTYVFLDIDHPNTYLYTKQ